MSEGSVFRIVSELIAEEMYYVGGRERDFYESYLYMLPELIADILNETAAGVLGYYEEFEEYDENDEPWYTDEFVKFTKFYVGRDGRLYGRVESEDGYIGEDIDLDCICDHVHEYVNNVFDEVLDRVLTTNGFYDILLPLYEEIGEENEAQFEQIVKEKYLKDIIKAFEEELDRDVVYELSLLFEYPDNCWVLENLDEDSMKEVVKRLERLANGKSRKTE